MQKQLTSRLKQGHNLAVKLLWINFQRTDKYPDRKVEYDQNKEEGYMNTIKRRSPGGHRKIRRDAKVSTAKSIGLLCCFKTKN